MANKFLIIFILAICCLMTSYANNSESQTKPPRPTTPTVSQTCPAPTEQLLRCLGLYACQHAIRLDLRCLLNLNGNPLLGGLLGGTGGGLLGGTGGGGLLGLGGSGGGNGVVGGLLGR